MTTLIDTAARSDVAGERKVQIAEAMDRPFFIVGPGRSGTTLLRSVLSAHSCLTVTPETHFMTNACTWGWRPGDRSDGLAFWDYYTQHTSHFADQGVDADACRQRLAELAEPRVGDALAVLIDAYRAKMGKARVGEKTPGHWRYLEHLLQWFPGAKVVICQRDPRAIIASQLQTPWVTRHLGRSLRGGWCTRSRLRQVIYYANDWNDLFEKWLPEHAEDTNHVVSYEALTQDPQREVRDICDFLGETFEPQMIAERSDRVAPPASSHTNQNMQQWRRGHHQQSVKPISTASLDKWKSLMSPLEAAVVECLCDKTMRTMGYEPQASPSQRVAARAAIVAMRGLVPGEQLARHTVRSAIMPARPSIRKLRRSTSKVTGGILAALAHAGLAPRGFAYRTIKNESPEAYLARAASTTDERQPSKATIHPIVRASHPLPVNILSRDQLPDDAGWWGYSFRDVPQRQSGETITITIPAARVISYRDPAKQDDFYPAVLTDDCHALEMRELKFRPPHAVALQKAESARQLNRAVWVTERVYHNHSHWLTAHLPKLLMLKQRDMLKDLLLPAERNDVIDTSLRMAGIEPNDFATFTTGELLEIAELVLVGTDRFRPELLRLVPQAYGVGQSDEGHRRIYISRAKAARRKLSNEKAVWEKLEPLGFEQVFMEDLSFAEQVDLMRQTAVLAAPHGAGLTNMMFCPQGTHTVEIADPAFPNPNFYALASGLGHRYYYVQATSVGTGHPLEKDLQVDPESVLQVVRQACEGGPCASR